MQIINFTEKYYNKWDKFVKTHPKSNVYHNSAWFKTITKSFPYKQKGFLILENNEIKAGLPLFEVKGLFSKRLVSNPFRDRGCLLYTNPESLNLLLQKIKELTIDNNYDYLVLKGIEPIANIDLKKYNFTEQKYWISTNIDLSEGTKVLWKKLKNNAQGPVKQARKFGVTVNSAKSLNDMKDFYNIYLKSRQFLGIPSFSYNFFINIWENMAEKGLAKLFLAKKGNKSIAGILLFTYKDIVIDAYAASISEYRKLRANDLLVWNSFEWAEENKFKTFDFGADSPLDKNLLLFKKKWLGTQKIMHHYFLLNKTKEIIEMNGSEKKYAIARKILQKTPLPLFKIFSNKIVNYLG
jgi:serine/alanine adding enzyme